MCTIASGLTRRVALAPSTDPSRRGFGSTHTWLACIEPAATEAKAETRTQPSAPQRSWIEITYSSLILAVMMRLGAGWIFA